MTGTVGFNLLQAACAAQDGRIRFGAVIDEPVRGLSSRRMCV
jgi:hypothetical protein